MPGVGSEGERTPGSSLNCKETTKQPASRLNRPSTALKRSRSFTEQSCRLETLLLKLLPRLDLRPDLDDDGRAFGGVEFMRPDANICRVIRHGQSIPADPAFELVDRADNLLALNPVHRFWILALVDDKGTR